MEIKKINIHNIASIKDAEIDFTAAPLANADVFLISGKTGAGKSTILDSISLALYGTTPRLENLKEKNAKVSDNDIEITARDPRHLMRRGAGECSVSLLFAGNDGTEYESSWSVSRAGKKPSGRLQSKIWVLRNLKTGTLWDKDNEIKPEILKTTGLTFDQFCRTTMLAQGDFLKFLNSSDDDKSEILEKITGTRIYTEIGSRIFEKTSAQETEYKTAKKLVDNVSLLPPEQVDQKKQRIQEISTLKESLEKQAKELQTKNLWITENNKINQQIADTKKNLAEAQQVTENQEFRNRKSFVKEWNDTIDARQQLKQYTDAMRIMEELKQRRQQLNERYNKAAAGLLWNKNELTAANDSKKELDSFLNSESDRKAVYEQHQLILSHLAAITDNEKKVEENKEEITKLKASLEGELTQNLTTANDNLKDIEKQLTAIQNELSAKEKELEKLDLPTVRKHQKETTDTLNLIELTKTHFDSYLEEKARQDKERDDLVQLKKNIDDLKAKLPTISEESKRLKAICEERKQTLDKMSDSMDDWAKVARAKLQKGDKCPVCQQVISQPLHVEEELQRLIDHARDDYKKAEQQYQDNEKDYNKKKTEADTLAKNHERRLKELEKDSAVLSRKLETTTSDMQKLNIQNLPLSDLNNHLSTLSNNLNAQKNDIAKEIESGEKTEKDVKEIRAKKDSLVKKQEKAKDEIVKAKEAKDKCQNNIDKANERIAQLNESTDNAYTAIAKIIGDTTWNNDWQKSRDAFTEELKTATQNYNEKNRQQSDLKQTIDKLGSEIANVTQCLSSHPFSETVLQEALNSNIAVQYPLSDVNDILSSAAIIESQTKDANEKKESASTWLSDFHNTHPDITSQRLAELSQCTQKDVDAEKDEIEKCEKTVTEYEAVLKDHQTKLKEHEATRPQLTDDDINGILPTLIEENAQQMTNLSTELGTLTAELKADDDNRLKQSNLIAEADNKKRIFERWESLCNIFGDKNGKTFRTIAQSYVLSNLIHSANHYMRQLSDRYELKVEPGSFVIEVVDAYQGYTTRASSTISGGEGFLVSLALALALSDIGKSLSANILFIDEGFGTLSGEPLQNAINTLRALHSQTGRHVGIISHIEELQERLPVQIQVVQEGHNSHSTVVIQ